MSDVVYAVEGRGWIPKVIREGDQLQLIMGIDINRGYDIREFQFPLTEEHLAALRASLSRHLILWCVLAPLAEKASTGDRHGTPDPVVAAEAIDTVLLGTEQRVEEYVAEQGSPYELQPLIAHGGDPVLIGEGRIFQALAGRARVGADWKLVRQHRADETRAARGVHLGPLDRALLRYTNRYEGWSGLGARRPEQVPEPDLSTVLELVAAAGRATGDLAPTASLGKWEAAVGVALREARPELLDEPIRAVASLLRDEAPARDFSQQKMPALDDVARDLRLHLYDGAELALIAEVTPDAGARPLVQHVGGELFVGVERRVAFGQYVAVTQDDGLLWEGQQRVTFGQLIAAGIAKAQIGKHVARDGTCWISFADLAAAVLVDAETRSTIIDPARLPPLADRRTLVPDGDLVVAPLSRLRFVMTGSRDENGMLAILKAAREAIQWGRDQISPRPLVWRHGRWLPFDWAAEFPQLAGPIREVTDAYSEAWLDTVTR